jgi:predicted protein tyrosine phosphatase
MSSIHVCALSRISETAEAIGATSLVTLINVNTKVERPACITPENHLFIGMSDITTHQDGHILPAETHVEQLLDFARSWDRRAPLLIHCYAGVSRSTAAAFIAACALKPERDESELAELIRQRSPTATPNAKLIEIADQILGRRGRMSAAIDAIGRGSDCFEGVPFSLEVG